MTTLLMSKTKKCSKNILCNRKKEQNSVQSNIFQFSQTQIKNLKFCVTYGNPLKSLKYVKLQRRLLSLKLA